MRRSEPSTSDRRFHRDERFSPHPRRADVLAPALRRGARRQRPHLQQAGRLPPLGLLLRQGRCDGAAGGSALARAARRQRRPRRPLQRLLEGLPRRPGRRPGGRARARPAASCARASTAATRCSTPAPPASAALFTGNDPTTLESGFGTSTLTAAQYNSLWLSWGGFLVRPDNFDDLVAERYGSAFGGDRNPYPKPGENPNTTNGGTGRLPEMFTQLRNPDGKWSGRIGDHLPRVSQRRRQRERRLRWRQQPRRPAPPAARRPAARLSALARDARQPHPNPRHEQRERHQPGVPVPGRRAASARRRAAACSPRARRPRWTRRPGGTWDTVR